MGRSSPLVVKQSGEFKNFERFLQKDRRLKALKKALDKFGQRGVDALSAATPVRTGVTAASWRYNIAINKDGVSIYWCNDNLASDGTPIVKLLVRGHGTRDGHYIRGNDFVSPAIQPIFDEIADEAWAEVIK